MEQTLGKRISFWRKQLKLTQDQLAEQLGVTAQAVSKWENDQSCPDITILPRLAEIFSCTTDELLGIQPAQPIHEAEIISESVDRKSEGLHISKNGFEFNIGSGGRMGTIGFAVLVLAVGGLYLAAQLLRWDVSFWSILWPTTILISGLFYSKRRFSFGSLGCIAFGAYFLLDNLHVLPFELGWKLALPIALLLFGISLLVKAIRKPSRHSIRFNDDGSHRVASSYATEGETFTCDNAFCDNNYFIDLPRMSGGTIDISFGTITVDLSGVGEVAEDCTVNVDVAFAQGIILVPARYQVALTKDAAFGSVRVSGESTSPSAGTIHINADVAFGELTIEYI